MKDLHPYDQQLLDGWEDVYKKGQLTLWILLALKQAPGTMAEIKDFMSKHSDGVLDADDKSMYRALRRYNEALLVDFVTEPGQGGPDRKCYYLTETGFNVLQAFLERNIVQTLYKPALKRLIASTTYTKPGLTREREIAPQTIPTKPKRQRKDGHYGKLATES